MRVFVRPLHWIFGLPLIFAAPAIFAGTTSTATTLSSSATPVPAHTVVTLTASVTSVGIPVTRGQVKFCNASAPFCTDVQLVGTSQLTSAGTATAKFVPGPGVHAYKAVFVGTSTYGGSTSNAANVTVTALTGPQTTIVGVQASGTQGNYALLGTVATNGLASPTGTVSFLDTTNANYILGTAKLGLRPRLICCGPSALRAAIDPGKYAKP